MSYPKIKKKLLYFLIQPKISKIEQIWCRESILVIPMPEELQQNNAAKAYYGLALETYQRVFGDNVSINLKQLALETARAFDQIIDSTLIVDDNVLVDWQQKSDIIGRMKIDLEDYLIDEVKRKYELAFSFDDMDAIIDGCVDVAKLWIK